jgi:hypothetical protein
MRSVSLPDTAYTNNSDYTTLAGALTVMSGSLTVENLVIR